MVNHIRVQEYKVLVYRIFLVYIFYAFVRLFFTLYNLELLKVDSISQYLELSYYGLAFDTTAILYTNLLFILLSVLPFKINTERKYQKFLMWIYFIFNGIGISVNFLDFIYYRFTYSRSTSSIVEILKNESNTGSLLFRFIGTYWHVYLLFILTIWVWVFLYKRVQVMSKVPQSKTKYFGFSLVGFLFVGIMIVGGIRGDFKKSTRPINNIDASRHVKKQEHADIVLNTTFSMLRTLGANSFKKINLVSKTEIDTYVKPVKQYTSFPESKPNIVLFIIESFGREYLGAFNKPYKIKDYVSYSPFIDSLAQHSMVYTNAYCNGSKSIHGMSSVIAGVPSFKVAFTSSPYPKQKIQSLVSCLKEKGYHTSFFHGAANGSMGFLGFSNILGYDKYYGRTEFNNDTEFDGSWGIWDEPFFQFMKQKIDKEKGPFFSTIFTVSSHEPFVLPEKYENKFPKGKIPMHKMVGYTDFALKKFFESAKKEPWFKNTLFVFTADHCNQPYYPFYLKQVNWRAVPIMFYKPDGSLKGESNALAQQIDIYPTVLDMIGYKKPFRSWGRSLISEKDIQPFVFNYNGNQYQFMHGKYICTFDGIKITGVYASNDYGLEKNVMSKISAKDFQVLDKSAKAFLQDYMQRIMDRQMFVE